MAAPITNSNETLDSITEGLLIHEAPSSEVSHALLPPFLLDSWDISCPHADAPLISLSSLRLENIVSFWRAFSSNRVSLHNSAAYKGGKSYFQPCKNNSDTFTAVCRLMDLDKQHKDGEEYSVFLAL